LNKQTFLFERSLIAAILTPIYDAAGNKVRLSVAIFLSAEKAHKKDFHYNP